MALRDEFLVRAPIDRVFQSLEDPRWLHAAYLAPRRITIALETPAPIAVGARFRLDRGVRGAWFWEVTEYEPPKHLSARVWWSERGGVGHTTYDLEPTPEGTVVRMRGGGYFGPVGWTMIHFWPPVQSAIKAGNRELASAIEAYLQPA